MAVTAAPAITAPVASETAPVISAKFWAPSGKASAIRSIRIPGMNVIVPPQEPFGRNGITVAREMSIVWHTGHTGRDMKMWAIVALAAGVSAQSEWPKSGGDLYNRN